MHSSASLEDIYIYIYSHSFIYTYMSKCICIYDFGTILQIFSILLLMSLSLSDYESSYCNLVPRLKAIYVSWIHSKFELKDVVVSFKWVAYKLSYFEKEL